MLQMCIICLTVGVRALYMLHDVITGHAETRKLSQLVVVDTCMCMSYI